VQDHVGDLIVWLVLVVRRFRCENEACRQQTFSDRWEGIGRSKFAERLWAWIGDLGRGQTETGLARERRVSTYLARRAAKRAKTRAVSFSRPRLPEVLAIGECLVLCV
jgi:hypothetical protein